MRSLIDLHHSTDNYGRSTFGLIRIQTLLLTLSFLFYTLAKQQMDLPQSAMQALGILFLGLAALRGWKFPSRKIFFLVLFGMGLLCIGWMITGGLAANVINSMLILISFPLVMSASQGMIDERLLRNIMIIIVSLCMIGIAQGETTVSYFGDVREMRWTLGFQRPTFLAEAMVLFIIAVVSFSWRGLIHQIIKGLLVLTALWVLVKTGSRAGLGAGVIFLFLSWEFQLEHKLRLIIKLIIMSASILVVVFLLDFESVNQESFNHFTTGRWDILLLEIAGNMTQLEHWLLGNSAAETAFQYSTMRDGLVYHFDSFFGERLIITGILGLTIIVSLIWLYARQCSYYGRAVIAASFFYGLFENGIFNITSMFATYMLLFAFSASHIRRTGLDNHNG